MPDIVVEKILSPMAVALFIHESDFSHVFCEYGGRRWHDVHVTALGVAYHVHGKLTVNNNKYFCILTAIQHYGCGNLGCNASGPEIRDCHIFLAI